MRSVNAHSCTDCRKHVVAVVLYIEGLPGAAGDVMKHAKDAFYADSCFVRNSCVQW